MVLSQESIHLLICVAHRIYLHFVSQLAIRGNTNPFPIASCFKCSTHIFARVHDPAMQVLDLILPLHAKPPPQLFRNLAKLAGVHQYIETPDVVWANKSMLAVCVDQPGKRAIKLPRLAKVTELYSNKVISAEPVKTFTVDFPENATLLFRLD